MGKRQHVVPNRSGGWSVRGEGAARVSRTFLTQRDAIAYARDIARNQSSELIIHGRDGTIKERDTYGQDPYPPKKKH